MEKEKINYKGRKAFITGINGQDGSYLSEYLLSLGYEVHGIIRRNSTVESQQSRFSEDIRHKLNIHYGDLLDQGGIERLFDQIQPDEIYNLAAQSHVRISFDIPQFTVQTNAIGVLNVLEAYRRSCPKARFYQASSSEMFGNSVDLDGFQRETTPMNPVSPYGCSKVFGYNIVRNYRNAYKLHTCNGILFNHESPRRGSNFVTNKVVKTAVEIKLGLTDKLVLGNMDSYRDWGHSKDYCIDLDSKLLTPSGYKFRHELNIGDEIINYNTDKDIWEKDIIEKIYDVEHKGNMYVFSGNGFSHRFSPNHRIIYQRKSSNSKNWGGWLETTAENMYAALNDTKLRAKYNYRFPGFVGINNKDYDINDNMIILIGYLATEGCLSKSKTIGGGMQLSVSQSSKKYLNQLVDCINALKLKYNKRVREDGVNEFIFNAESRDLIIDYFDGFDIHELPSYIYNFSKRQAQLLFETMMNCDGCWSSMTYISTRLKLAKQFYDIANLANYRCKIVKRKSGTYDVSVFSKAKKSVHQYITDVSVEYVEENIWCVETQKNKTIITEGIKGRFISGNCKAMHMIINHDIPDDFVVSTMTTHSVREMVEYVFGKLDLDYTKYVYQDQKFLRAEELKYLKGDSTKIRETLGWKPEYSFETLMDDMINGWMNTLQKKI